MFDVGQAASDLVRRYGLKASIKGDEAVLYVKGDGICVSADRAHERIVFWGEVARDVAHSALQAAQAAALEYNRKFASERCATFCVSAQKNLVFLGRSLEPVNFGAEQMMREASQFSEELAFAQRFFQTWPAGATGGAEPEPSNASDVHFKA